MRRCFCDDTFSCFDRASACDGQTDERTDGHTATMIITGFVSYVVLIAY